MRRKKIFGSYNHELDESLINLTPLIDVVFVVLIAFIIVAPLLEVDKVELSQAGPNSEKVISSKSPIHISVKADDTIWINNRMVSLAELTEILKEIKRKHPHQIPQVYHDKQAHFGIYQALKNSMEAAGFEQMDILLKAR